MDNATAIAMMQGSPEISRLVQQKNLLTDQFIACTKKASESGKSALVARTALDAVEKTDASKSIFVQDEFVFIKKSKDKVGQELKAAVAHSEGERARYEPMSKTFQDRIVKCEAELRSVLSKIGQ